MPQIGNRRQVIKRNLSGGTAAPRAAAGGRTTGLNRARPANRGRAGLGQNRPAQGNRPQPQGPAPQPQGPAPMPWDAQAAISEAGAGKRLGNTLTGLDAGWGRTQQAYGLEGPWADYTTNPYSQAALLQRSYDIANRSAVTGSGLGLYSGSQINARNFNTRGFNEGRDELQKAYAEDHARYQAGRAGAQDDYNEAIGDAGWRRVEAGMDEPLPEVPAPGGGKKKNKKKARRRAALGQNQPAHRRRRNR